MQPFAERHYLGKFEKPSEALKKMVKHENHDFESMLLLIFETCLMKFSILLFFLYVILRYQKIG